MTDTEWKPTITQEMIDAGARLESEWDGRTFDAMGAADKRRYRERFHAALMAAITLPHPPVQGE